MLSSQLRLSSKSLSVKVKLGQNHSLIPILLRLMTFLAGKKKIRMNLNESKLKGKKS